MKRFFCLLCVLLICLPPVAHSGQYTVETLTPGGPLTSLAVDDTHVWVGSFTGLYRFDKQQGTWDFFDETDGLSGNSISALTVTADGSLWAAASRTGLNRYEGASWSHTDIGNMNIGALSYYDDTVFAAQWDVDWIPGSYIGDVFAISQNQINTYNGFFQFNSSLYEFIPISVDSFYLLSKSAIAPYPDGRLIRFVNDMGDGTIVDLPYPTGAWDIASAADTLWAVSPDGICFLDGESWTMVLSPDMFPTEDIWSIATDSEDRLWLLSRHGDVVVRQNGIWNVLISGLDKVVLPETAIHAPRGGQAYSSTTMNRSWAIDNGTLWSCTEQSLFRFDGTIWEEIPVDNLMVDTNFTSADAQGDGTIWAVNAMGILEVPLDGGFMQYEKGTHLPDSTITSISVDDADQIWATVGTGTQLKFTGTSWENTDEVPVITTVPAFRDSVVPIFGTPVWILPNGSLYEPELFYGYPFGYPSSKCITSDGIVWLVDRRNPRVHESIWDSVFYTYWGGTEYLSDVVVDQQGALHWVTENNEFWMHNTHGLEGGDPGSTEDGVIAYNFSGDVVESYTLSDGFPVPYVTDITEAPDGSMIVATPSGLFRIQRPLNTAVEEHASHEETGPAAFIAPYPNPFNARVTIPFTTAEIGSVECAIYSTTGQRIRTLVNSRMQPGYHQVVWDGTDETGNTVATGLYLVRLLAGGHATTARIVLLK